MSTTTITETTKFPILSGYLKAGKLDTSGKMLAILGYIADVECTDPTITDMVILTDGGVLAQHEGDIGLNEFIGCKAELDSNLNGICDVLEIIGKERKAILTAIRQA